MRSPGELFAEKYEVLEVLGQGGMCHVFLAIDIETPRLVALKVLMSELAVRPDLRKRFDAEARSMASIQHRNVLPFYDVGECDEQPYIAMEYAESGCLNDWIEAHGPMPPRMASDAVTQVCKGVGAAHAVGIIHRDIKTHNVLVTARGVCKISDFGIARSGLSGMTATNHSLGTPGFMAPEQRNAAKEVGARADVYALGSTLYHLLTGRMGPDLFVIDDDPAMVDGIPECLIPVLRKATRYHAEERYATGAEMARALYEIRGQLSRPPADTPTLADTGAQRELPDLSRFGDFRRGDEGLPRETTEELVRPISLTPFSDQRTLPRPRSALGVDTPIPDYVDKSSLSARERGFEITVDPASRIKAEEARQQALADGVLQVAPVRKAAAISPLVIGGLGVLALAFAALVGLLGWTVSQVNGADRDLRQSHAEWYAAIEASSPQIATIDKLGGHANALAVSRLDFARSPAEPERELAADAFQAQFVEVADRVASGETPAEVEVRTIAAELVSLRETFRSDRERAARARSGPLAAVVGVLGLVSAPESASPER